MDLEPIPALSVNISLYRPGSPQTKSVCVRRRGSHPATVGDSSFNPATHAERMTLLIPGLSAGNSGHQTRRPVSARVRATCYPSLCSWVPSRFSLAKRGRGSCLCHQPTLTHHGSRTEKGARGSVKSSCSELGSMLAPGKAGTSPSSRFTGLYGHPSPMLSLRASFSARSDSGFRHCPASRKQG